MKNTTRSDSRKPHARRRHSLAGADGVRALERKLHEHADATRVRVALNESLRQINGT